MENGISIRPALALRELFSCLFQVFELKFSQIDCDFWPHRIAWSSTLAFQAKNTGSNPVGATLILWRKKNI